MFHSSYDIFLFIGTCRARFYITSLDYWKIYDQVKGKISSTFDGIPFKYNVHSEGCKCASPLFFSNQIVMLSTEAKRHLSPTAMLDSVSIGVWMSILFSVINIVLFAFILRKMEFNRKSVKELIIDFALSCWVYVPTLVGEGRSKVPIS